MYLWYGAVIIHGDRPYASAGTEQTDSEHHGQQADGEYHALRDVPVYGESDGRFRYGGGVRSIDSYALYSRRSGTLGATRTSENC